MKIEQVAKEHILDQVLINSLNLPTSYDNRDRKKPDPECQAAAEAKRNRKNEKRKANGL